MMQGRQSVKGIASTTAIMVVLIVCGCGSDGKAPPVAEVEYNCAANATDIAILDREIPQFTEATGIKIRLNPFAGEEKLQAMMAAGQAPDIFYTNAVMRDQFAAAGQLLDLRGVSAGDSLITRLWPQVVEAGLSVDSGWYSVGNWQFTAGMYYNKDLFDQAHVPYPDTGWTWTDMVRIAERLTRDADGNGIPEQYGLFIGSHFVELIEQMNNAPIERNALTFALSPESADAYNAYLRLLASKVMPDIRRVQAMGMQAPQMLQTGRVAMLMEAVPHQTLYETLTIRWGVAPLPRFAGKPPRYFRSGSGGLSVSAQTKNPVATWKALKWIIANASIYQPNPVLRDVDFVGGWERRYPQLKGSGFKEVWNRSVQYNGGDQRFFVRFSSWTAASILERLQPKLDRLWAREITVEQLRQAVPDINANVRRELSDALRRSDLSPSFARYIEHELQRLDATPVL
jgi:ABC-type glycerol-3-phosphate transport system substrate-binding protein